MNHITLRLVNQVLDAFTSDSAGLPNTLQTRAEALADCDMTFEAGFKIITIPQLKECYDYGVYSNSFSKWRSRFDENGRIALSDKPRNSDSK